MRFPYVTAFSGGHIGRLRRLRRLRLWRRVGRVGAVGALLGLAACASLTLTTIKTAQQRPSNVAIYFKVETEAEPPVAGLTADRFRIYEDGQLVSQYESKQVI